MNEKIKWIGGFFIYPLQVVWDRIRLLTSIEIISKTIVLVLSLFFFKITLFFSFIFYLMGNYGFESSSKIITIFQNDKFLFNCIMLFIIFAIAQICIWQKKLDVFLDRKNLKFKSKLGE